MYAGLKFRGGTQFDVGGSAVANALTKNVWHHLRISIDKTGYTAKVDGQTIASAVSGELANWSNPLGVSTLTLGNFDGWIDEVVVRNVRSSTTTNPVVSVPTITPGGSTFTAVVAVTLATGTSGATIRYTADGSTPTSTSPIYLAPITLTSSATVRAFASKSGMTDSSVASAAFTNAGGSTNTSAIATATFVKSDAATQGNWKGVYGNEGYNVVGNADSYPSYVQVSFSGRTDRVWAASTTETRAPLKAASTTDRIAASAQTTTNLIVNLDMNDNNTHRFAMYFLDWERNGRVQTVEVIDAITGTILNTQNVSSFEEGKYLVWDISGDVKVRLTYVSGVNANLQAIFFDSSAAVPTPDVAFVKSDTGTKGNWKGVYGADGFNVVNNSNKYPATVQVSPVGKSDWVWAQSTAETRCLLKANSTTDRIASSWEAPTNFTLNVNVMDGNSHRMSMYFMDFDHNGRSQTVEILDATTGAVLDTRTVSSFDDGKYLVWDIKKSVKVRLTRIAGFNATMQGLFFDAGMSVAPATVKMGGLKKNATGQFQADITGAVGQQFRIESSTNLATWTPVSTNTLTSTTYSFTDTSPVGKTRFFRAVPLP